MLGPEPEMSPLKEPIFKYPMVLSLTVAMMKKWMMLTRCQSIHYLTIDKPNLKRPITKNTKTNK